MKELTIQQLRDMKPRTIINTGTGTYPEVVNYEIRWVAISGLGYYDWTIYFLESNNSVEQIIKYGDKMYIKSMIKRLVPCTDEAFSIYRY